MADARITQSVVEVVAVLQPDARVTQAVVEVVSTITLAANARITQSAVEVVSLDNTVVVPPDIIVSGVQLETVNQYGNVPVRATAIALESIQQYAQPHVRATAVGLESVQQYAQPYIRVSQIGLEVLRAFDGTCAPIPECPTISKTGDSIVYPGQTNATWEITVTNETLVDWVDGITVTDTLPDGVTLVSMSGDGWTCDGNVCERTDDLVAGASFPVITVVASISEDAESSLANVASLGECGEASFPFLVIPNIIPARTPIRWALHRMDIKIRREEKG